MERIYDLIIIGAGPAGMSAAIYASRAGLDVGMIEEGAPGGKLTKTHKIENYPGIIEAKGFELASTMFKHSTKFGAQYIYGSVKNVSIKDDLKVVKCQDDKEYFAKTVLVATGTRERLLNIDGEQENVGKGVSYCAVCDGAFFKEKDVVVIGGGNSALEEASYLTQFARKVYIVIRRDVFRAEAAIIKSVEENEKIEVIKKHIPIKISAKDDKVNSITLKNVDTNEEKVLEIEGVFPYIGSDPITEFVDELNICDEHGYIPTDDNMESKIEGIYAAGDVREKKLRQVVTATNDGAIAAQAIVHKIKSI